MACLAPRVAEAEAEAPEAAFFFIEAEAEVEAVKIKSMEAEVKAVNAKINESKSVNSSSKHLPLPPDWRKRKWKHWKQHFVWKRKRKWEQ